MSKGNPLAFRRHSDSLSGATASVSEKPAGIKMQKPSHNKKAEVAHAKSDIVHIKSGGRLSRATAAKGKMPILGA